jgi:hypothetical protein
MHINAADSLVNYNIIKNTFVKSDELGVQKYDITNKISSKISTLSYDYYYTSEEINYSSYIIKRLFIEVSPIFTLSDLIKYVKNPPFKLEYNSGLFDENSIQVALYKLLYKGNYKKIYNSNQIDRLFNSNDKIISWNNTEYIITTLDNYFILCEFNDNNISYFPDSLYRKKIQDTKILININSYFQVDDPIISFQSKFKKLHQKFHSIEIFDTVNTIQLVCQNDIEFQRLTIEYCIQYVVDRRYNKVNKSPDEDFIIKCIEVYDYYSLILFFTSSKISIQDQYNIKKDNILPYNNLLRKDILKFVKKNIKSPVSDAIKQMIDGKIDDLPIGHGLDKVPRFYHPDKGWFDVPDYSMDTKNWKENDIIIGYNYRNEGDIVEVLKLRPPIQSQKKSTDARKLERGSLCVTYPKDKLIDISKKLGINVIQDNTKSICEVIKLNLLEKEYMERKSNTDIKYFYFYWETQPI